MRVEGKGSLYCLRGKRKNRHLYKTSVFGAGDGNRTHTTSLEGWDSAIELHPHIHRLNSAYIYYQIF